MSGSYINFRTIPNIQITDTTASNSSAAGCATFAGGIGVAGAGNFGGRVNALSFATGSNFAPPSFFASSSGTKLLIFTAAASNSVDYAIGLASGVIWQSVPQATNAYKFSFYGGITEVASIGGTGIITGSQYRLSALNTAPASATSTGETGTVIYASDALYFCIAANTWRRILWTTF